MEVAATVDDLSVLGALVKDAGQLANMIDADWEELLRLIKRNPAKQLALLLHLRPLWKNALTCVFAGQLPGGGDRDLLSAILELGGDPNAIERDLKDEVKHPAAAMSRGHSMKTPLESAVAAQSYDCCELLLQHGATPNPENGFGRTVLDEAVAKGSVAICELLLRHGANPNAQDLGRRTINVAAAAGSVECCALLLQYGAIIDLNESPLFDAAKAGSAACCELLLRHGVDANVPGHVVDRHTGLHEAAQRGFAECLKVLLDHGADPSTLNGNKETALHYAAKSGHATCCELLLKAGSDPNAQDKNGSTPLHAAASKAFAECCEILVCYGADATKRDTHGRWPIHRARSDDDPTRLFLIGYCYEWDAVIFRELCNEGKTSILRRYLDTFRIIKTPPRQPARVQVYYHDLYYLYGPPWLQINHTPLFQVLNGANDVPSLVDHPVFEAVLNLKWAKRQSKTGFLDMLRFQIGIVQSLCFEPDRTLISYFRSFGRVMSIIESLWFLVLLVSTYWSFVSVDLVVPRGISIITAVLMLTMELLDWHKRRWSYFRDATNWINLVAYGGVLVLGILSAMDPDLRDADIARAVFIVLLSFCGLEYLRMVPLTSLLIAITFEMVKDVLKFVLLYGIFQIGFSGSFFLLFQDEDSRYNTYREAFLATFLMLFGDLDSDMFLRLEGVKAVVANTLVLLYLVGAVVMLMNLLIAMMSTSYQEVVDSAKVSRSIVRAETILRMEGLLPHLVREHMFGSAFFYSEKCSKAYELHVNQQKGRLDAAAIGEAKQSTRRNEVLQPLAVKADDRKDEASDHLAHSVNSSATDTQRGTEKSVQPLLASLMKSDTAEELQSGSDASKVKATEERPVARTDTESINSQPQTKTGSEQDQPAVTALQNQPNKIIQNRPNRHYVKFSFHPFLDDCVVYEYVEGMGDLQSELLQSQASVEAKLSKSEEMLVTLVQQLDLLKQHLKLEVTQELTQKLLKLEQAQDDQARRQELRSTQLEERVLAKLQDLQQQLSSDTGVASPSKRFSFKR